MHLMGKIFLINNDEKIKFGFVAIIGKPNSGKSTLLNSILNKKISIATNRKNTTRNNIKGIYNDLDSQIVFIDTPGFLEEKNLLDEKMKKNILESISYADLILYLEPFWKDVDENYINKLNLIKEKNKMIYLISQIDKSKNQEEIFKRGQEIFNKELFKEIIPISSKKNFNIEKLISIIKNYLEFDLPYYDRNNSLEYDKKFYSSEIIREKILLLLNYELPHRIFVKIEDFKEGEEKIKIFANIYVEKDSQKIILIGKNGEKIKRISSFATSELKNYFNKKVELKIFIKVRKNWKNSESIIKEI